MPEGSASHVVGILEGGRGGRGGPKGGSSTRRVGGFRRHWRKTGKVGKGDEAAAGAEVCMVRHDSVRP